MVDGHFAGSVSCLCGRRWSGGGRTAYMVMGLGGAISLLVWAFFLKPDFSVLVIYGMTLLGGIAYACDQVINTPFLQTTMPKENYSAAQGMISFAGSAGGTICGAVAGAFLNSKAPMEKSLGSIYLVFGLCLIVVFVIVVFGVKVREERA